MQLTLSWLNLSRSESFSKPKAVSNLRWLDRASRDDACILLTPKSLIFMADDWNNQQIISKFILNYYYYYYCYHGDIGWAGGIGDASGKVGFVFGLLFAVEFVESFSASRSRFVGAGLLFPSPFGRWHVHFGRLIIDPVRVVQPIVLRLQNRFSIEWIEWNRLNRVIITCRASWDSSSS